MKLRPYQAEALGNIHDALWRGNDLRQRPAMILPTGGGKTVIFSHLAKDWTDDHGPVTVLVHRDELVRQTVEHLGDVAPDLPVGIVQGPVRETTAPVAVASVQTLSRDIRLTVELLASKRNRGMTDHLLIVDECHHATAPTYSRVMEWLGCFTPYGGYGYGRALGVTATLARGDGRGLGGVWESVVFRRDVLDLIPEYLCDVAGKQITVNGLSLAELRLSNGDLSATSLSQLLESTDAAELTAQGYREHASRTDGTVRPGICFTPSVATAESFCAALRTEGITAEVISGEMPTADRRRILGEFNARTGVDVLVNCMVLTEGFDAPRAEVCVIARPTASAPLYVQMVGRVLRLFPGKDSALVLDLVGATADHRLATLLDLSSRRIREIRPGETLAEAAQRERRTGNPFLSGYAVGSQDVDLFDRSRSAWLQTHEGVWFLPAGQDEIVFLWPDSVGTYRVGVRPLRARGGRWTHEEVPLNTARSFAQTLARDLNRDNPVAGGANLVDRSAPWRRAKPGAGQLTFARDQVKISADVLEGLNRGQISDLITIELASRALDRNLKRLRT